jgi:hypothetical protein
MNFYNIKDIYLFVHQKELRFGNLFGPDPQHCFSEGVTLIQHPNFMAYLWMRTAKVSNKIFYVQKSSGHKKNGYVC